MNQEQIIIQSALERKGVFYNYCKFYAMSETDYRKQLIIYDGTTLYPINYYFSESNNHIEEILVTRVVGSNKSFCEIENILSKKINNYQIFEKNYMQFDSYDKKPDKPIIDYIIRPAISEKDINEFYLLKEEFNKEELGSNYIDQSFIISSNNRLSIEAIKPFLLIIDSKVVGVICSNFQSKEISMINTLFVKDDFRNKGLAKTLLHNYINYLLLESKSICLFYSPYNTSAGHIYDEIGFVLKDDWKVIVGIDEDLYKIKLFPVKNDFIYNLINSFK